MADLAGIEITKEEADEVADLVAEEAAETVDEFKAGTLSSFDAFRSLVALAGLLVTKAIPGEADDAIWALVSPTVDGALNKAEAKAKENPAQLRKRAESKLEAAKRAEKKAISLEAHGRKPKVSEIKRGRAAELRAEAAELEAKAAALEAA